MKLQIVMKTRSLAADYSWRCWPEYLSSALKEKADLIQEMLNKSANYDYAVEESLHNYYFIPDDSGSLLIHSVITADTDMHGRRITTIEGLACPGDLNRIFWYSLPYLIDRFEQIPLFRTQLTDILDDPQQMSQISVQIPDDDDRIFLDMTDPESLWQEMADHSGQMARLQQDIFGSGVLYSFVYGSRDRTFYPAFFERVYSPVSGTEPPRIPYRSQACAFPVIDADEKLVSMRIEIEKHKNEQGWQAYISAIDKHANEIARTSSSIMIDEGGIALSELLNVRKAVLSCLYKYDYGRGIAR